MKKIHYICILLFIGSLWSAKADGLHVYVSPGGNDLYPGTKERPLASLRGARDKIRELRQQNAINDTVFVEVMQGEYYSDRPLMLSPQDAGTKKSPIIYRGRSDARPVFYGGIKIDRFEVVNPELWRVYIPETAKYGFYFEQLYINGERRFRAQTPNRGEFNQVKRVDETILDSTGERIPEFACQKIIFREDAVQLLKDLDPNELSDVLIVFYHNWDNTRKYPRRLSVKDTAVYLTGKAMQSWNKIDKNSRYIVENYRKALDAPGEWFLQRDGYLYYIPMPGETPDNTHCLAPVSEHFITMEGSKDQPVEYIRFENLRFEVSGYRTPVSGNEALQAAADVDAAVMLDYARNIRFFNCDFAHTGLHTVWFRKACSDSKMEHCRLHDLGGGGIKIGDMNQPTNSMEITDTSLLTRRITIHNNIIHHGGFVFPSAAGIIIFHGSDNNITHNEIADFRYTGISVGWVWGYGHSPSKRNKIEFNHIHHLGWGELCDMGGVYLLGASEGTTVRNNLIHHIYSFNYGGWGLYTDEGAYKIVLENNLVYACKNAGFHQHYGKENIIRNNIFAFNVRSQMQLSRPEEHLSFTFTNNIIYCNEGIMYLNMRKDSWVKANVKIDYNCYWDTRTKQPDFCGMSFADWQKLGRDQHSVIANPLFENPEKFDFRFKKTSVAKKIGFKPFDYGKAGVYGSDDWVQKARMSPELEKQYDEAVKRNEKLPRLPDY